MDSFTSIAAYIISAPLEEPAPVDKENGGSGSNVYCVVAKSEEISEAPADSENGGSGSNVYCVVA